MPTITAERVAELSVSVNGYKSPRHLLILEEPLIDFRIRKIMGQPGGPVYTRETIEEDARRQSTTRFEYWFSTPARGLTMRDAYPRFSNLFRDGMQLMRVSGMAGEPQLYLETDRWGQPLVPKALFKDAGDGQYKGQYKERY